MIDKFIFFIVFVLMTVKYCLFVIVILCPLVCSLSPLPNDMMRGIAITPDGPLTLADNATLVLLDQAINIGADWIFVNSYLSQINSTSSKVFKGPQAPLDSVLKSFVETAQSKGLKVLLKPIVIPLDDSSWLLLHPEDPNEWFKTYTEMLCSYGELLPTLDAFSVGLELTSLTVPDNFTQNWMELISSVRKCSNAKLTYSSLFLIEWREIRFWDQLDWIGIDEYLPVASDDNPYPSLDSMTDTIATYFGVVENYLEKHNLTSKPIVLTELGIYSYTNATFAPAYFPPGVKTCNGSYAANYTTQQLYFEASFNAINQYSHLISGVFMYQ